MSPGIMHFWTEKCCSATEIHTLENYHIFPISFTHVLHAIGSHTASHLRSLPQSFRASAADGAAHRNARILHAILSSPAKSAQNRTSNDLSTETQQQQPQSTTKSTTKAAFPSCDLHTGLHKFLAVDVDILAILAAFTPLAESSNHAFGKADLDVLAQKGSRAPFFVNMSRRPILVHDATVSAVEDGGLAGGHWMPRSRSPCRRSMSCGLRRI